MLAAAQLPFAQADPIQVAPQLRELQATGPIHLVRTGVGDHGWLVTRHALVRQLLDDERLGRSHPEPATAPRLGESMFFGGPVGNFATEADDTARIRQLLQPHFTPRHMRAMTPRVEALTAELLDELEAHGSPADLHTMLAEPLPILVICELLGVPTGDREQFREWSKEAADTRDRTTSERGIWQLFTYGQDLIADKRRAPGDDVISRLCAAGDVDDDAIAWLSMAMLFAGHETTVSHIGLSTLLLLAHPEQWQTLVDRPELVPSAVEETLRASHRAGFSIPRYARTDLEVEGVRIKAGDLVLLDIGAGNLDPAVFTDPERVDVCRSGTNHLSFGYGIKYCIGAPLARIELQTVLSALVSRFPTLRLAVDVSELTPPRDLLTAGLTELPVRW